MQKKIKYSLVLESERIIDLKRRDYEIVSYPYNKIKGKYLFLIASNDVIMDNILEVFDYVLDNSKNSDVYIFDYYKNKKAQKQKITRYIKAYTKEYLLYCENIFMMGKLIKKEVFSSAIDFSVGAITNIYNNINTVSKIDVQVSFNYDLSNNTLNSKCYKLLYRDALVSIDQITAAFLLLRLNEICEVNESFIQLHNNYYKICKKLNKKFLIFKNKEKPYIKYSFLEIII